MALERREPAAGQQLVYVAWLPLRYIFFKVTVILHFEGVNKDTLHR